MSVEMRMDTTTQEMPGDYLRREREARLISVAAVSKALKVDYSWINSLEHNDCSAFSNEKDIPDLLRRYAKFLLIDADDLIRRYETQPMAIYSGRPKEGLPPAVPKPVKIQAGILTEYRDVKRSPRWHKRGFWLAAFGVVLAIQLIIFGIYPFFYREPVKVLKDELRRMEKSVEARSETPRAPRVQVIGNRDSRRYHLPGMKYYHAVNAYHRVEFNSEAEAVAAGYHKAPR